MDEEFKKDFRELCDKYGGTLMVIELWEFIERDEAFRNIVDHPGDAKFHAQLAYWLDEIRGLLVSRNSKSV